MRPDYCLITLHVAILASLYFTLEAVSQDSECYILVKVRRNTVYEAFLGKELRINCKVQFCNNITPTVSWYKIEKTLVPVNISRIRTEWKRFSHLEGTSYLVFQNILRSDSGVYRCRSGGGESHTINVTVHGDDEPTPELQSPVIQDHVWPCVYRAGGIIVFVMIVTTMCVTSKSGCKGARCAGPSKDTPDPSYEPSHHALSTIHIYDNDQ